ncbi:MAG TPA: cytochrome c family protein [Steroidobacter sp.]|uniref:c-type cytochrome n=1 Tax=Steroidobacter sp. TaxID=1978227 RepID=UPI002EDA3C50
MMARIAIVMTSMLALSASALGADDAATKRGQLLFMQCRACHDTQPSSVQKVGPNLTGFFGRPAASAPGYKAYSAALKKSGVVWNDENLDKWLQRPSGMVPGTTMVFAGVQAPADRAAIIAYLKSATAAAAAQAQQ